MSYAKTYTHWTEDDFVFLTSNYGKLSYKDLGSAIGKTPKSIKNKANAIGLTKLNDPFLTAELEPGFCHVQEAAATSGRSVATMLLWCRQGKLPGAKKIQTLGSSMWLIPEAEISKIRPAMPRSKTRIRIDDPHLAKDDSATTPTRTLVMNVSTAFLDSIFRQFSFAMPAADALDEVVFRVSR